MQFPSAISNSTLQLFKDNKKLIESDVIERSLKDKDKIQQHGKEAKEVITSGIHFTTEILESAMSTGEMTLLKDQIEWAQVRLVHDHVLPSHIICRLNYYKDSVLKHLPKENANEIFAYLEWMVTYLKDLERKYNHVLRKKYD